VANAGSERIDGWQRKDCIARTGLIVGAGRVTSSMAVCPTQPYVQCYEDGAINRGRSRKRREWGATATHGFAPDSQGIHWESPRSAFGTFWVVWFLMFFSQKPTRNVLAS
jgi:hypothetical protein